MYSSVCEGDCDEKKNRIDLNLCERWSWLDYFTFFQCSENCLLGDHLEEKKKC